MGRLERKAWFGGICGSQRRVQEGDMAKAQSKKQQMAAGAALAAKRGEKPKSSLRGASKGMAKSMSEKELENMAHAKRKKLPTRKSKS